MLPDATAGSLFGFSFSGAKIQHDLKQLHILRRDLLLVSSRYVDSHKFKSDLITEMFLASIDKLEEDIDSILTEYQSIENLEKRDISSLDVEEIAIVKNKQANQGVLYLSISGKQRFCGTKIFQNSETSIRNSFQSPLILTKHYLQLKINEVEYTLINGLLRPLDPHTLLLPPIQKLLKWIWTTKEKFGGLGIENYDQRWDIDSEATHRRDSCFKSRPQS